MHVADIGRRLRAMLGFRPRMSAAGAPTPRFKVLLVCRANVCRSPMACVVASALVAREPPAQDRRSTPAPSQPLASFQCAGTHADHAGVPADHRARAALRRRGYDVGDTRSRPVMARDFEHFDLILAMDCDNLADLRRMCPPAQAHKLRLFLDFHPAGPTREVPDPYYGDLVGFERVLDLCELGARSLIAALQSMAYASVDDTGS
jgi:protein-tyrosine phosphatase